MKSPRGNDIRRMEDRLEFVRKIAYDERATTLIKCKDYIAIQQIYDYLVMFSMSIKNDK